METDMRLRIFRITWAAFAATLFTVLGTAVSAQAVTVTCTTPSVALYHLDGSGQLRRWSYPAPLTGGGAWSQAMISSSWGGDNTISGGDGVIYAISSTGALRWYKDNNFNGSGGANWHSSSGSVIGSGWTIFSRVLGAGNGVIYGMEPNGTLRWYRHLGPNADPTWAAGSGSVIGSGWNIFASMVSSGNGILYGVATNGDLRWYRHLDPLGGTSSWANGGSGVTVGSGWNAFTRIGSFGAGVLLGRDGVGNLLWYRHLEPLAGSDSWANSGVGISQGTGWSNSQLVGDVTGCKATP